VVVPDVTVYSTEEQADANAEAHEPSLTNTSVFTKEQSWKLDFATDYPAQEPFGQVIKTTARVQSSQGDEIIVSAKSNGMVIISSNEFQEGTEVSKGQTLCSISGSDLADNNLAVRYAEAKNNYERAKSDFERATELAQDKIVSEKDLLERKNQFENARAVFDNLNKNYNAGGQSLKSPMNGFIKQVFVKNGTFVEAGQPILTISQNKTLNLIADVRQKHLPLLGSIKSANIRSLHDNQMYTLEALNGKVLSYGKTGNSENFQIPVTLQIDNKGSFFAGGFVEIYLKTMSNTNALTVPNQALVEEQGIFSVYVQVTPELFEKREVTVGATDGLKTEILKGLTSNDRIVTRGAIYIKLAQSTGALDAHSGHVH
jgi:RND family efflux transporter MFP subunit